MLLKNSWACSRAALRLGNFKSYTSGCTLSPAQGRAIGSTLPLPAGRCGTKPAAQAPHRGTCRYPSRAMLTLILHFRHHSIVSYWYPFHSSNTNPVISSCQVITYSLLPAPYNLLPTIRFSLAAFLHKVQHSYSSQIMQPGYTKTIYEAYLSDVALNTSTITKERATAIFNFFKSNPLFRWSDANNDCEDRANAICILLDEWKIPNYKAWVFAGAYLKREEGSLVNFWNYHVAALLPVHENGEVFFYVIDPATSPAPELIYVWAEKVTHMACSYYLIKEGNYYIFPNGKIFKDNWFRRNRRNYNWTMQGLAGINGVSKTGQAALAFNKSRLHKVETGFRKLRSRRPETGL